MLATMLAALTATAGWENNLMETLHADVTMLAGTIGPRSVFQGDSLRRSADYLTGRLEAGGWTVRRLGYPVSGVWCENLEVERKGASRPDEIVVIGAHYDTVPSTPGADDNASGVAALLALAEWFAPPERRTPRTLRFVAFVNEEPIYFQSELMGSRVYARACRKRGDNIVGMVSLESIGYYADERGSQQYPLPLFKLFFPSRGNFLAFVGNRASKALVTRAARAFKASETLPVESAALPEALPGIGWSDHWAFWQEGYPAIMVTGTAPYRNPHYHAPTDTPDTLDYDRLRLAVIGLRAVVADLAGAEPPPRGR
jgi:Zn-dependent M28 family amino/carboxypeptidase